MPDNVAPSPVADDGHVLTEDHIRELKALLVKSKSKTAAWKGFVDKDGKPMLNPPIVLGFQRLYTSGASNSLSFDINGFEFLGVPRSPDRHRQIELATGKATMVLEPGAGIILGKPGSGKTLFTNTLVTRNPGLVDAVRFREPEDDSMYHEDRLVTEITLFLQQAKSQVLVVDSLRTIFYAVGGSTGKGGVNMGLFETLTLFDLVARHFGKVILFTLNPMTTDEEAIAFYLSAAEGSVAFAMYATSPGHLKWSSRFSDRGMVQASYTPIAKSENARLISELAGKSRVTKAQDMRQIDDEGLLELFELYKPN